jgi:hypothetical protein
MVPLACSASLSVLNLVYLVFMVFWNKVCGGFEHINEIAESKLLDEKIQGQVVESMNLLEN